MTNNLVDTNVATPLNCHVRINFNSPSIKVLMKWLLTSCMYNSNGEILNYGVAIKETCLILNFIKILSATKFV